MPKNSPHSHPPHSHPPHSQNNKELRRSTTNREIAGVCGGIAEYFDMNPSHVRLLTVLSVFFAGISPVAYLVAWALIPEET